MKAFTITEHYEYIYAVDVGRRRPLYKFGEFLRWCNYKKIPIVYKESVIFFTKEEDRLMFLLRWS